ncbi:hypothetical protein [Microbulbifer sp. TRSA005]
MRQVFTSPTYIARWGNLPGVVTGGVGKVLVL